MTQHAELHLRSPLLFRFVALGIGLGMVAVCSLALYAIWVDVLPVFGRLYRGAPVVETSFGAFFLIGVISLTPIVIAAAMTGFLPGASSTRRGGPGLLDSSFALFRSHSWRYASRPR